MAEYRDIVIAGGGMVGVSLALQLGALLPERISVSLVEHMPLPEPVAAAAADYHPAFDARSTALSYSSRLIYERIGLWPALAPQLCAIEDIHVSTRGRFGSALLRAEDYAWPALGYVVENAWLGRVLMQALRRQGRAEVRSPARVTQVQPVDGGVRLSLAGDASASVDAGLLVVAAGAGSGLGEALGVAVTEKSYGQQALVANIATALPHRGRAFERFTAEGPLALLPLSSTAANPARSALVWTLPPARAQTLRDAPPAAFLAELQRCFGYRLGRLQQVGERHTYPLSLLRSREQLRSGVVVVGNAAHALHPVAGQGFNLALRDIASLAQVLAEGVAAGRAPGELGLLQRYLRCQAADQQRTIDFSDRIPGLFMRDAPWFSVARDLALAGLDAAPGLKREFVRHAAGIAALSGQSHD